MLGTRHVDCNHDGVRGTKDYTEQPERLERSSQGGRNGSKRMTVTSLAAMRLTLNQWMKLWILIGGGQEGR